MSWVVSLPMYNVTPTVGALWESLLSDVVAFVRTRADLPVIRRLGTQWDNLSALWSRSDLLLSQTCGYPLVRRLPESIQIVGTPLFDVPGCDGADYSSVLVVSASSYRRGVASLEACRGLRAAYNDDDSNSGMNVFRHAVAPYACQGRFFSSVIRTGSHIGSLAALATGEADVASIDCVTFALAREAFPELLAQVRAIGFSSRSPGLPLIASAQADASLLDTLRAAFDDAVHADAGRAKQLRLRGIAPATRSDYRKILELESAAVGLGYPVLT